MEHKYMLKVIDWNPKREAEAIRFLEQYPETALSLLSDYTEMGPHITDHPCSGNFKLLCKNNKIVAVFYLTKMGDIFIQTDKKQDYSEIVLKTCLKEKRPIMGIVGDWEITKPLWDLVLLKFPSTKPKYVGEHFLYRLDLDNIPSFQITEDIRFLEPKDVETWQQLRKDLLKDLGYSPEDVQLTIATDRIVKEPRWGLFIENELVSIATYDAIYKKMARIASVFTKQKVRGKGLATQMIKKLILDSKNIEHLDTLILNTANNNFAAQKIYEKVGFKKIGKFGLFFWQAP